MITIFTNPRPFVGPFDTIQRNAIASWLAHRDWCEVILFNDEAHTAVAVSREFGIPCITDVACNEFGTPLLSDVFAKARARARFGILAQVNTDIILMEDFFRAVGAVARHIPHGSFLFIGRRHDLDVDGPLAFTGDWETSIRVRVAAGGRLHGLAGLDYWVFPRTLDLQPPDFAVGRPGMDSWLIYRARSLHIPVVDGSAMVTAVHQNHSYPMKRKPQFEIEKRWNLRLAGGYSRMMTLRDADWLLAPSGFQRPPYPRRVYAQITLFRPWRAILAAKRWLQGWRRR